MTSDEVFVIGKQGCPTRIEWLAFQTDRDTWTTGNTIAEEESHDRPVFGIMA
jgi:hypothetical protein